MRKVLVILTLIILLVACSEDKSSTAEERRKEMVYATLSGTKYHKTADCSALKRSKSNVDEISVVQAEAEGKEPCRRCYKH